MSWFKSLPRSLALGCSGPLPRPGPLLPPSQDQFCELLMNSYFLAWCSFQCDTVLKYAERLVGTHLKHYVSTLKCYIWRCSSGPWSRVCSRKRGTLERVSETAEHHTEMTHISEFIEMEPQLDSWRPTGAPPSNRGSPNRTPDNHLPTDMLKGWYGNCTRLNSGQ